MVKASLRTTKSHRCVVLYVQRNRSPSEAYVRLADEAPARPPAASKISHPNDRQRVGGGAAQVRKVDLEHGEEPPLLRPLRGLLLEPGHRHPRDVSAFASGSKAKLLLFHVCKRCTHALNLAVQGNPMLGASVEMPPSFIIGGVRDLGGRGNRKVQPKCFRQLHVPDLQWRASGLPTESRRLH